MQYTCCFTCSPPSRSCFGPAAVDRHPIMTHCSCSWRIRISSINSDIWFALRNHQSTRRTRRTRRRPSTPTPYTTSSASTSSASSASSGRTGTHKTGKHAILIVPKPTKPILAVLALCNRELSAKKISSFAVYSWSFYPRGGPHTFSASCNISAREFRWISL